jgi:hypothetical protein
MKRVKMMAAVAAVVVMASSSAFALPTGQINIPSVDAKGLKEVTVSINNNVRFSTAADAGANMFDVGVVTGVLPFEKVKLEIGADYGTMGSPATKQPFTLNAKLATAEDALFTGLPAFAIGSYNLGNTDPTSNAQNIVYALAAKTFGKAGRFSVGGYNGAESVLGKNDNLGILASWDRTISEVSDKLWLGVDFMSGTNADGEVSIGGSWTFSKQITLLTGVTFYNRITDNTGAPIGGKTAFTTQLSINLP